MNRRDFVTSALAATVGLDAERAHAAGPAPPTPLLIDSHCHVWKRDPAFPFAAAAREPEQDGSAEMLLDLMRANGVARTVIIQFIAYRWDNRYIADVLRRYPDTFIGLCRVDPNDPAAPDILSRLVHEDHFHGVRISPGAGAGGDWIRGGLMPPLWRRCAELRVPMTVLTPITRMPDLARHIEQNPDLVVVIDHMADCPADRPDQLQLLLALARYPRVFVKISHMWSVSGQLYPFADAQVQVRRLFDAFGPARLMWGTDWPVSLPYLPYADAVALYRDHLDFLSPADRTRILSRTVQTVWPFGLP
jgi:predicted TIM-barrel fold metal-dependent hydrolase